MHAPQCALLPDRPDHSVDEQFLVIFNLRSLSWIAPWISSCRNSSRVARDTPFRSPTPSRYRLALNVRYLENVLAGFCARLGWRNWLAMGPPRTRVAWRGRGQNPATAEDRPPIHPRPLADTKATLIPDTVRHKFLILESPFLRGTQAPGI